MSTSRRPEDRLRRVTDLFVRGKEIYLGDDETGTPILVWVSKPNQFERSEARKDGLFGKQKRLMMLALDSEECLAVRDEGEQLSDEELVEALLSPKQSELILLARDDVEADENWHDRLELLERWNSLTQEQGSEVSPEENERFIEISTQYIDAINEAMKVRARDFRQELASEPRDDLIDKYVETYRQNQALAAFQTEAQLTELYFALRDCEATERLGDGWDHSKCKHPRLAPSRADVRNLGDVLLDRARSVLIEISVSEREAGNSDAPASSSASSERPKQQEESTPSTPSGT